MLATCESLSQALTSRVGSIGTAAATATRSQAGGPPDVTLNRVATGRANARAETQNTEAEWYV